MLAPFRHTAGNRPLWLWVAAATMHFGLAALNEAALGDQRSRVPLRPSLAAKQAFTSRCGVCHGMDGRGGEHASDIGTAAAVQQLSDADLGRILENGIPSRGMPSFSALGPEGIREIIRYLRALQGRGETVLISGDPIRGKALFFGAAHCSKCHMIRGSGGFLGPDLSGYSRSHTPETVRQEIVDPNRDLSPKAGTVTAVTRDGRKLTGIARNEDNFSLQLQTPDGSFHLLIKSELTALSHSHNSLMPADYGSRLSARDLGDLASFLGSADADSISETADAKRGRKPH